MIHETSGVDETIAGQFKRLDGLRSARLASSEQFAYYTIPSVFPRLEAGDDKVSLGMLDSIGASVVNHFSNKLITTLFSPNRPFFRITPNPSSPAVKQLEDAIEEGSDEEQRQAQEAVNQLRSKFTRSEKSAVRYLERIGYRTTAVAAAKLLVITGDVVIKSKRDKKSVAYSMRDYVCEKDLEGTDITLIVRDSMSFGTLPENMQNSVRAANDTTTYEAHTPVVIYTRLALEADGRYRQTQAADMHDITAPELLFAPDDIPYQHISWNLIKGENYGRGLVEDYGGSFHMIDMLTDSLTKVGAKLGDVKIFVDPASGIDVGHLNSSDQGTYIAGRPGDTGVVGDTVGRGIEYLENSISMHKRQIANAFLYRAGTQRDAERVTAEEIREDSAELELAHGGVYSRFSTEWQAKVARDSVAANGTKMGDVVEPTILTGLDSLSRTGEMRMVRIWIDDMASLNNVPEDVRAKMDISAYGEYAGLQRGITVGNFMKSKAQLEAEAKAMQDREDAQRAQEMQNQAGQAAAQAVQ